MHNSISHSNSANIDKKAKARPLTETFYGFGESKDSTPLNTGDARIATNNRIRCPFTGAIQVVCVLWKLAERSDEKVFSNKPMPRPLTSALKRPLDIIVKRRQIQAMTHF